MSNKYLEMDLLRFTTAGSVDDGKSTLIGRLLYDSKSIFQDQMEAIETASQKKGEEKVNLALLTDGLRAEREQGITIDVAYRYFATPNRKFIIADTPGHIQYTRNMVTGASTANLAIILVDARNGIAVPPPMNNDGKVYVKNNTSWAPGPPGARQNALQKEPIFIKSDVSSAWSPPEPHGVP